MTLPEKPIALRGRPPVWTRGLALDALAWTIAKLGGRPARVHELAYRHGCPSCGTLVKLFGSTEAAMVAAEERARELTA